MTREVHIISYFSLPTDLAAAMRDWPEFITGQGYSVELACPASGEAIRVRLVEEREECYVSVSSVGDSFLFEKVLGRVVYALAAHSDHLLVDRVN